MKVDVSGVFHTKLTGERPGAAQEAMARVPLGPLPGSVSNAEWIVSDKLGRSSGKFVSAHKCVCGAGQSGGWKTRSVWGLEESCVFRLHKTHIDRRGNPKRNSAAYVVGRSTTRSRRDGASAALDEAWSGGGRRKSREVIVDQKYEYQNEDDGKVRTNVPQNRGISGKRSDSGWQEQQRMRRTRYEELDTFDDRSSRKDGHSGAGGAAEVDSRGNSWDRSSSNRSGSALDMRSSEGEFDRRGGTTPLRIGRSSERYPNSGLGLDEENSSPGVGTKVGYETVSSRETTPEYWNGDPVDRRGAPFAGYVGRDDGRGQSRKKQEVSREMVPQVAKSGRHAFFRNHNRGEEGEVLERGLLYAKQVINQATARSLGVLTQLWVDLGNLKVVALEVRENLLFGNFDIILLNSLRKVGDVILIHNDSAFLDDLDVFNCHDLVGSDIFTENGVCLGKVRDYDFRLEDGAVLSVEFDSFGFPIIPSSVVSTYSLAADEVIEAQVDGLLVRKGAEKRVRKLTKGIFSRGRQPPRGRQDPLQQSRRQLPQVTSASSSNAGARAVNERQPDALAGEEEYTSARFPVTEAPYRSRFPGIEGQRTFAPRRKSADLLTSRRYEATQGQNPGAGETPFNSKFENAPAKWSEDPRTGPPQPKEAQAHSSDTSIPSSKPKRLQNERNRTAAPTSEFSGRGLPMSYREPKHRGEESGS